VRLGIDVGVLGPTQSGVARYLWSMVASLMELEPRLELTFYSNRRLNIPLPSGQWRLRCETRRRHLPYALWLQHRCPRMVSEDRVDVFWGQNYTLPLNLQAPCLRLLTVHDVTAIIFPRTMSLRARLISRLYARRSANVADRVLVVSQATARLVHGSLGVQPSRVRVVYPGRSLAFRPASEAHAIVTQRFGLRPGYLLTVGNIEPRKDHGTLLSALEKVPGAPLLVIVGSPGWRHRSIVSDIQRHERAGSVRYLGRVEDSELAALYSVAKLMVYPSFYEGFGSPIAEAMSCGCPVLCAWSSSLPEVGGQAACYFRPRDSGDLARRLSDLLANDRLLGEMRVKGIEQAAKFSYSAAAGKLLEVLREMLSVAPAVGP
jgi:glycosyltransferase involved in cell wall biosynthesis